MIPNDLIRRQFVEYDMQTRLEATVIGLFR